MHLEDHGCSQQTQAVDAIVVLSLCPAPIDQYLPGKGLYTGLESRFFATAAQGILPDHLGSRAFSCGPTELCIFNTLLDF